MMSKKMKKALNAQINAEFYSSYLYLSMGAYFEAGNLPGFARWMYNQAQEEWAHGTRFYNYIYEQQGKVTLLAIEAPKTAWDSPLAVFEAVYKHEQHVTSLINDLVSLALEEKDYATNIFLQWFVSEQVEEESSAATVVEKLKMVGDNVQGLFMMDSELGQRPAGLQVPFGGEASPGAV